MTLEDKREVEALVRQAQELKPEELAYIKGVQDGLKAKGAMMVAIDNQQNTAEEEKGGKENA